MQDSDKSGKSGQIDTGPVAVPHDFPRPVLAGAVAGSQPKLLLTRHEGKFYQAGCTPPEVRSQWEYCESIAQQLAEKSIECKAGKRGYMDEAAILDQYFHRLVKSGWASNLEELQTMRRCAKILSWPMPNSIRPSNNSDRNGDQPRPMSTSKRTPRGMPESVVQGTGIPGQMSGRASILYQSKKAQGIITLKAPAGKAAAQLADFIMNPRLSATAKLSGLGTTTGQSIQCRSGKHLLRLRRISEKLQVASGNLA